MWFICVKSGCASHSLVGLFIIGNIKTYDVTEVYQHRNILGLLGERASDWPKMRKGQSGAIPLRNHRSIRNVATKMIVFSSKSEQTRPSLNHLMGSLPYA